MIATATSLPKRFPWKAIALFASAFWLSSSLIIDLVIMPGLYASGMMAESGFVTAGYSIFWMFNRIEIMSAALLLTSLLAHHQIQPSKKSLPIVLAFALFGVAIAYTYALTPTMSGLGLQLNLFESREIPAVMNQMQQAYWALEAFKLMATASLLGLIYRDRV